MALKNKYVVFAVLGLAVASGAAWWFQSPARSSRAGAPAPQGNAAAKPGAQSPAKPVMVEATKVRQMTMRDVPFGEGCVDFVNVFSTLQSLNYRGAFLIEMWTEKAKEPVLEIIQARRWIEARMQEGGFIC